MKFSICLPVFVSFVIKNVMALDCYWSTECKYKYFSSKTPYESVRGDIRDSIVKTEGCEPISVWTLMRHGKMNPGTKFLQDIKVVLPFKDHIISSYDIGNSTLCAQDIDNFRKWEIDASFINEPNEIEKEGYQEIFSIGRRLKEALPEIYNDLREGEYSLRPTFGPRSKVSSEAFIEGLGNKDLVIEQAEQNVSIASPYATCRSYLKEVFRNPGTYRMSLQYMDNPEFIKMKGRIERRLGLTFTLTNKHIIAIYDLCRYTSVGVNNTHSPWCAVFSEEDLKIIEYVGDLEHFYRSGYGAEMYSNIFGQITLADLFMNLEQAKNGQPGQRKKTIVYITHSSMMDMVIVALNLYKDESPLTAAHRDLNRKWRSSFLSSFGVNVIAILNRCRSSDGLYVHNISLYRNERPFLELCKEGICSWQEFEDIFRPFLNATLDICEKDLK